MVLCACVWCVCRDSRSRDREKQSRERDCRRGERETSGERERRRGEREATREEAVVWHSWWLPAVVVAGGGSSRWWSSAVVESAFSYELGEGEEKFLLKFRFRPVSGVPAIDNHNHIFKKAVSSVTCNDDTTLEDDDKPSVDHDLIPSFGVTSVCGRRQQMEDAYTVQPSLLENIHYFAVYDGHGGSQVAKSCKDRLHLLVKEELRNMTEPSDWRIAMERSFRRMDGEVASLNLNEVGSTAVVAVVTRDHIVVANCGDSRAVLCRNGKTVALSRDHKPDRPDELKRIEAAGGTVLYWQGARVCGCLAMSRALGDYYLKPYVTCEPEVTVTARTSLDELLILGSDGLWDVLPNDGACGLTKRCLERYAPSAELKVRGRSEDDNTTDVRRHVQKPRSF